MASTPTSAAFCADGAVDGLAPHAVVAAGESQSAAYLTTYVNDVDPHAGVYDGFLVHSRFGPAAPLDGTSVLGQSGPQVPQAVPFRPDLRVPVMTVITETDLIGGLANRVLHGPTARR